MAAKENIIEVKGLMASFGDTTVLTNVSFSAPKGDITVILGSSGGGKSTILRHLLGLYTIQQGEISVLGHNLHTISEKEQHLLYLKMGVFYQNGALLNSMTLGENVALPLTQHTNLPNDIITDMVYTKLRLVNLEDAFNKYPSELSGGMLKRAALARAIIMDPPLLFCDEPGAGLDPISLESLDNLILKLKELLGISVLMVTHEVSTILRIADWIIFLDKGMVAFEGEPKHAFTCGVKCVEHYFNIARGRV